MDILPQRADLRITWDLSSGIALLPVLPAARRAQFSSADLGEKRPEQFSLIAPWMIASHPSASQAGAE